MTSSSTIRPGPRSPRPGETWQHVGTGVRYKIQKLAEDDTVVVYRSKTRHGAFVRSISEFMDGRFRRVTLR